jgi:hypothetical protein
VSRIGLFVPILFDPSQDRPRITAQHLPIFGSLNYLVTESRNSRQFAFKNAIVILHVASQVFAANYVVVLTSRDALEALTASEKPHNGVRHIRTVMQPAT